MADENLFVLVEQPSEQPPQHERSLALFELKSKIYGKGDEQTSPLSSSSKLLQCPKIPKKLLPDVDVKAQGYDVPKLISLGPYHHGHHHLARGETLKLRLVEAFFFKSRLDVEDIYNSIGNQVGELKACYEMETAKKFTDDNFKAMVDGCALLGYIICVCLGHDHEDYDIRYQDLSLLHQDALLLENQLPYQLLQLLMESVPLDSDCWTVIFQEFFGMIEESFFQEFFGIKEKPLLQKMKTCCGKLFSVNRIVKGKLEPKPEHDSKPCRHLLDLYRRNFLGDDERSNPTPREKKYLRKGSHKNDGTSVRDVKEQLMASFRNVKELMAAGIHIKSSPTRYLRDISFTSNGITGYLRLPPITIDKSTKTLFLNLIAYEMSSDASPDFISYLRFLDSLIDHADDVKELQSAGVLQNNLGTHEEVAEFFNTVSAKLDSDFRAYKDVRVKIRKHLKSHYNSKRKGWVTQCLDTYFGTPWTIIAWIAAALALFLTAVQTYFSAFSR